MAFEITDLQELDPELVTQMLSSTRTRLQERHPEMDLKRGNFHDTILYDHAVLEAALRTNLRRYLSARSLLEIERDPTLADGEVVDSVLSLYRVVRQVGTTASGQITVVVSDNTTVTIPIGSVWVANGQQFLTTQAFTAKPEVALIANDSDRLITQLSDDNWGFVIDVVAAVAGPAGKLAKDTKLLPVATPANYLTSYATSDFADGTETETNQELLEQLEAGLAARALSNRGNMRAMLREQPALVGITRMSIVGHGDAEMLRDQHTIFPLKFGGRVDWYIRGQAELQRLALTKEAVLIEKESGGTGIWQFSLGKDDAPGFYEIRNIRLTGVNAADTLGGFEIVLEQRGLDLTGTGLIPDIVTQSEGAYSRYQTSVIQFRDTRTNVTALDTGARQLYELEVAGTPLVAETQELVSSRDVRHYGADALIKAPIPCFVRVTFTINKKSTEEPPDTDAIAQAVRDVIHDVPFTGRLDASSIHDTIHRFLSGSMSVTATDLLGRIRRPDDSQYYLRDAEALVVEDDPARMVTAKTVQFFAELDQILISVENNVPIHT
jgi:hypothetical protein